MDYTDPMPGPREYPNPTGHLVWMSHWVERPRRVWTATPACADPDVDTALFFPKGGVPLDAIRICQGCPVRLECLEYAIDNDEPYGLQGGVPEGDRARWVREKLSPETMIRRTDVRYPATPGSDQASSSVA